jgi:hypothetical protein
MQRAVKRQDAPDRTTERRSKQRHTLVLRVGVLESDAGASFCLLKNISAKGVQVKLFAPIEAGSAVHLRVGDEEGLGGRVSWVREGLAGIQFCKVLAPDTLLRVRQKLAGQRRRSSPRLNAVSRAMITTGGRNYGAELRDISTLGARVQTPRPIEHGATAILILPNFPELRAFVRWTRGLETGLVFKAPIPIQTLARWLERKLD